MTVREILTASFKMILKNELAEKIKTSATLDAEEQELTALFVNCLNLTQWEVCNEYIPIIFTEEIESENGEYQIASLSKSLAYINSLRNANGEDKKYKIRGNSIVFDGKATIEYCYVPQELAIDSKLEFTIPARVLAYGVLREYFLSQDLVSEASLYEEKLKNSLLAFSRRHGSLVMPKRNWC